MPYYQMGDYYRGDPGIFSFLGRAVKGVLGFGGATKTIVQQAAPIVARAAPAIERIIPRAGAAIRRVGVIAAKHPVLTAAGAAGVIGAGAAAVAGRPGAPAVGFHISKKTGELVRNRRMRVTNPRALRRAIRRATGFARLAKRVLRFTSPRAPRGRAVFKFRRRKKA